MRPGRRSHGRTLCFTCPAISADVYFGRGQTILLERERIKRNYNDARYHESLQNTIKQRRLHHQLNAA
jgi:hypothetical protein